MAPLSPSSVLPNPTPALFTSSTPARTPYLEFYTTFKRTEAEPNRCILEEPVEGTPLVIAVLFQTVEEARAQASASGTVSNVLEGKEGGTVVTLRISYQLAGRGGDWEVFKYSEG